MKKLFPVLTAIFIMAGEVMSSEIKHLILPDTPTKWDLKAVKEINYYSQKIQGKKLTVSKLKNSSRPMKDCLYIGEAAAKIGLVIETDKDKLGIDGYVVKSRNKYAGIYGHLGSGVLFGAYAFLEKCGVKIYGEECEFLPSTLSIPADFRKVGNPAFELRQMEAGFWRWNKYYRGFRAARLGFSPYFHEEKLGALFCGQWVDKKVRFTGNGHTTKFMIPKYKYWETHPEYFAHDVNGKLIISRHLPHICMSNPEVKRICKNVVLDWIKQYPASSCFFVGQEDLEGWCECPSCRAADPFPGKKLRGVYTHLADRVATFVNPIAKAVKKEDPSKRVLFVAYRETSQPLVKQKLEDNVRVILCSSPIAGCPCKSHDLHCSRNKRFLKSFNGWLKAAPGRLYIWNYCMNFKNRYSPMFVQDSMIKKLRFYHSKNVKGMFYNGAPRLFTQLFAYTQGKLLWEPSLSTTELENEFLKAFYGPASKAMKELLKLLRSRIHDKADPVHQGEYASFDPIIEQGYIGDVKNIFIKAEKAVADMPVFFKRVRYEKLSALLLPELELGMMKDEITKLDYLRQIAEIVNDWQLTKIKGGSIKFSDWIVKHFHFKIKYKGHDWTKAPLIQELLKCKTHTKLLEFSCKVNELKINRSGWRIIDGKTVKFDLAAFNTHGGGFGPAKYSHQCKERMAVGIYGGSSMTIDLPKLNNAGACLVLDALDHDKEGKTSIQIFINGKEIFSGDNQAAKTHWTKLSYNIADKYLKKSNRLLIRNLEKNEAMRNWIMFSDARVIFK